MRTILTTAAVALASVSMAFAVGPQEATSGGSPAKPAAATAASAPGPAHQQDEKAIRLAVEAVAKAYNAGDAKAIASLFVADGEIVSEEGQSTQGREGIKQVFAGIFKEHPKTHMDLAVGSVRFIGADLAVEDGMATVTNAPDEPADRGPYTAVHARQDGKWLMASVRDLPDEAPAPEEQLKQLRWMIGDWVDESPEALVMTLLPLDRQPMLYLERIQGPDRRPADDDRLAADRLGPPGQEDPLLGLRFGRRLW